MPTRLNMSFLKGSPLWSLVLSNFLFIGVYGLLGVNAIFLTPDLSPAGRSWIVLGISLFLSLQVGGLWLLGLFSAKIDRSQGFIFSTRGLAIILMGLGRPFFIFLSLILYGLSHAVFFKLSRARLADLIEQGFPISHRGYFFFGFGGQLAYIVFPPLGAFLIERHLQLSLGTGFALALLSVSSGLLWISCRELASVTSLKEKAPALDQQVYSSQVIFWDLIRTAFFLLPYGVMSALVPLKVEAAGLPASYNAFLLGLGMVTSVAIQMLGLWFKGLFQFSVVRYDLVSVFAMILMFGAFFSNVWLLAPLVMLYHIARSYQLPSLEHLLFTTRRYNSRVLNNFFLMDSVLCFSGSWIAALSVVFRFQTPFDSWLQSAVHFLMLKRGLIL